MPRMTDWLDTVINFSVATGAVATPLSLITGLAPSAMRGTTLIRTLVRLSLNSSEIAESYGVQTVNLAIGIASQEAFAAGVVPDPRISTDKPPRGWVYRTNRGVSQNGIGTTAVFPVEADIRGARKIENGEVYLVVDNDAVIGNSFTIDVTGLVRLLIKLP